MFGAGWFRRTLAVCVLLVCALPAMAQERIGSAASISNQVDVLRRGAANPLTTGGDVHLNERVRTGDNGLARLAFIDSTNLSIGPRSDVALDRFVYNPAGTAGAMVIRATQGTLRFVTGSQRPQNYTIQTPIASIGVRGTIFDLYVGSDRIVVTLISGRIIVTPPGGAPISVTQPGQSVTVYVGGRSVRRADWRGVAQPDFAALFGPVQIAGTPLSAPQVASFSGRYPGKFSFGLTAGGKWLTDLDTRSTSPFYRGEVSNTPSAFLIGAQGFVDVAAFGTTGRPFDQFVFSLGVMADYISTQSLQWRGDCGGVACTGNGKLDEMNILGAMKVTTWLSQATSVHAYLGLGVSTLWASGTPTGLGGPEIRGVAFGPAVRIGVGIDHKINDLIAIGLTTGIQFTEQTTHTTTLVDEQFRFGNTTQAIFGVTLTFMP